MSERNTAVIRLMAGKVKGEEREPSVLARYYSDNGADAVSYTHLESCLQRGCKGFMNVSMAA